MYESKYFKNKHFFLDPFALTIAQWCYIYGMHRGSNGKVPTKDKLVVDANGRKPGQAGYVNTYHLIPDAQGRKPGESGYRETRQQEFDVEEMKTNARTNLRKNRSEHLGSIGEADFNEMQESFWRYVCIWGEKGEWESWKEKIANMRSIDLDDDIVELDSDGVQLLTTSRSGQGTTPTEDDENIITALCNTDWYDPLQDTRPFYHATYNDVRGVGQVYVNPQPGGSTYTIGGKDEFQMRGRSITGTTSFMDILNNNVVFQT